MTALPERSKSPDVVRQGFDVPRLPPQRPPQRWTLTDAVLAASVAGLLTYVAWRTHTILDYRWNWSTIWPFLLKTDPATGRTVPNILITGTLTTLRLALWGIVLSGGIGIVMGLARTSNRLLPRLISTTYVMLIRNIPPVVFVFIFFYFIASQFMPALGIADRVDKAGPLAKFVLSILFGDLKLIENFAVGLLCLSMFTGAYVTEIVRAGIQSVSRHQFEAGDSLGLTRNDVMRFVVFPQAARNVLPPLAGQFIQLIKDSSLVSLVSIQELSFMAQDVQVSTQRVFEVLLLVAGIYFAICFGLSRLFKWFERRAAVAHR
jgi:polar amino acid transport system permease protein